ncbi:MULTISPECIES: hypothetical protein [Streptomycetaceae]|uniref:hypothetical protein n=1 Tax=Streptomycetaceae TaxID=2062 RepID=UPI0009392B05|nr:hypothetical protein [Streptomyces sp. CB02056]
MPARTRTKRRSALPALLISSLRPSTYNLRPAELHTVVCPDCQRWQQIVGATTLTIRDHHGTDLGGAELAVGQRDRRCPSARRVVIIDIDVAAWQRAQDRRVSPDAMPAEIRRPTTVLKKVKAPVAPTVLQIAQPRPAAPAPTAAERAEQWAGVRLRVLAADIRRELPLEDAVGPIRGAEVPTDHEDTREVSRASAEARTEQAIRAASPVRRAA